MANNYKTDISKKFKRSVAAGFSLAVLASTSLVPGAFAQSFGNKIVDAADNGNISLIYTLISSGEDVNSAGRFGATALHRAAYNDDVDVADALIQSGADLNPRDAGGATPLHITARQGYTDLAQVLLKSGADVNAKDNEGYTPLSRAIAADFNDVALALIAFGADSNITNNSGESAASIAMQHENQVILSVINRGAGRAVVANNARVGSQNNSQNNYKNNAPKSLGGVYQPVSATVSRGYDAPTGYATEKSDTRSYTNSSSDVIAAPIADVSEEQMSFDEEPNSYKNNQKPNFEQQALNKVLPAITKFPDRLMERTLKTVMPVEEANTAPVSGLTSSSTQNYNAGSNSVNNSNNNQFNSPVNNLASLSQNNVSPNNNSYNSQPSSLKTLEDATVPLQNIETQPVMPVIDATASSAVPLSLQLKNAGVGAVSPKNNSVKLNSVNEIAQPELIVQPTKFIAPQPEVVAQPVISTTPQIVTAPKFIEPKQIITQPVNPPIINSVNQPQFTTSYNAAPVVPLPYINTAPAKDQELKPAEVMPAEILPAQIPQVEVSKPLVPKSMQNNYVVKTSAAPIISAPIFSEVVKAAPKSPVVAPTQPTNIPKNSFNQPQISNSNLDAEWAETEFYSENIPLPSATKAQENVSNLVESRVKNLITEPVQFKKIDNTPTTQLGYAATLEKINNRRATGSFEEPNIATAPVFNDATNKQTEDFSQLPAPTAQLTGLDDGWGGLSAEEIDHLDKQIVDSQQYKPKKLAKDKKKKVEKASKAETKPAEDKTQNIQAPNEIEQEDKSAETKIVTTTSSLEVASDSKEVEQALSKQFEEALADTPPAPKDTKIRPNEKQKNVGTAKIVEKTTGNKTAKIAEVTSEDLTIPDMPEAAAAPATEVKSNSSNVTDPIKAEPVKTAYSSTEVKTNPVEIAPALPALEVKIPELPAISDAPSAQNVDNKVSSEKLTEAKPEAGKASEPQMPELELPSLGEDLPKLDDKKPVKASAAQATDKDFADKLNNIPVNPKAEKSAEQSLEQELSNKAISSDEIIAEPEKPKASPFDDIKKMAAEAEEKSQVLASKSFAVVGTFANADAATKHYNNVASKTGVVYPYKIAKSSEDKKLYLEIGPVSAINFAEDICATFAVESKTCRVPSISEEDKKFLSSLKAQSSKQVYSLIGEFKNEVAAKNFYKSSGLSEKYKVIKTSKTGLYGIQIGPVSDGGDAKKICDEIKSDKYSCNVSVK